MSGAALATVLSLWQQNDRAFLSAILHHVPSDFDGEQQIGTQQIWIIMRQIEDIGPVRQPLKGFGVFEYRV
jgi:hypothetical protein